MDIKKKKILRSANNLIDKNYELKNYNISESATIKIM